MIRYVSSYVCERKRDVGEIETKREGRERRERESWGLRESAHTESQMGHELGSLDLLSKTIPGTGYIT
jgi:hypothetical protein